MSPQIDAGDLVVTQSADADDLSKGEIITFQRPTDGGSTRVTHRIVAVEQTSDGVRYRTKGDASETADQQLVPPAQVEGGVRFTVPLIGRLVRFAGTDSGLVVFVIVPSVVLVLNELYTLYAAVDGGSDDSDGGDDPQIEEGDPS